VSGPASVSGSTLTILGAGSVMVTANQAGNANFAPAPPVSQTITVSPEAAAFTIASNPQSLTLQVGQSGTVTITVTPSGGFDSQVSFSCSQQSLVTCSFKPTTLTPNGAPSNTVLTVTALSAAAGLRAPAIRGRVPLTLVFGATFASFAFGIVLIGIPRRNRIAGVLCAVLVAVAITSMAGCGSGGGNTQPQTGVVTVSASAGGNNSHSLPLTITVTP